jgi:hypothetical protein
VSLTSVAVPLFEDEQVPQILPDDSPRVRRSDPVTSHQAADSISMTGRLDSQAHVLFDLRLYGRSAAWQIEERAELTARQWSPSRLRTALKELVESGRVVRSDVAGLTPRGRACAMYEVAS